MARDFYLSAEAYRVEMNARSARDYPTEHTDPGVAFYCCFICGQAVDGRRLGDVLWHLMDEHQPLAVH